MKCGLCGHEADLLGGNADETDLCHGCLPGMDDNCQGNGMTCYEQWTVMGARPGMPWRPMAVADLLASLLAGEAPPEQTH